MAAPQSRCLTSGHLMRGFIASHKTLVKFRLIILTINSANAGGDSMTQLRADVTRFLNDRLDWNLLRTFLVIMQERSVSRAAARLHLTQPAVSQALKRLEDTLGRNLIQRRGPHFEPTRAGEEVYRIASDIYGHMSRLETELD